MYSMCLCLKIMCMMLIILECDSGGTRRRLSSTTCVHIGSEGQETLKLIHRASKCSVDLLQS
jgi:hypothetical protein